MERGQERTADRRRLRVAVLRHSLLNRGGDRMVVQYANELARRGHEVTLSVNDLRSPFPIDPTVRVRKIALPGVLGTAVFALTNPWGCDVLIVDIIHLTALFPKNRRLVYFAQAHDVDYYANPITRRLIARLYRRFFHDREHRAIAVSDSLAETLRSRYEAVNIAVVENGIDLETFFPDPDAELLQLKSGRRAIVVLGRSDAFRKGTDVCRAVLQELAASGQAPRFAVWMIGEHSMELPSTVPFQRFPRPDDAKVRRILSSADAVLYPSRHEGFGLFPLEAMACGCPVVTTTAVPYARDGDNGFVTAVEDRRGLLARLVEVLSDSEVTQGVRRRGVEFSRRYDGRSRSALFEQALWWALTPEPGDFEMFPGRRIASSSA